MIFFKVDYSVAFSYRRSLIGSFNLSREGVKYAERYFENDYWDYTTHTGICSIQICGGGSQFGWCNSCTQVVTRHMWRWSWALWCRHHLQIKEISAASLFNQIIMASSWASSFTIYYTTGDVKDSRQRGVAAALVVYFRIQTALLCTKNRCCHKQTHPPTGTRFHP